jgi:hypothetical protein
MRTILAVAVMAVFAAGLAAQPEKKDFTKDGKFKAAFPTNPTIETKTGGGLTQKLFLADYDKGKGGYLVVYADLSPDLLKAPQPAQVLQSGEDGLKEYFKAKITKSMATTVGAKKYPAREITAEKEDAAGAWNLRGVIVLASNRLYQVYVFGPKDFLTSKEADAFLASFEITD